jgi:hypothetical protein
MYSHLPYFLYIAAMLCCSEDEESFDEDFFLVCEPPVFCLWCFVSLCRSLDLVISLVLRYVVINIDYTVYFTICRFMCEN